MSLASIDFPCRKCGAAKGEPCISLGGGGVPRGGVRARSHSERIGLVPPPPEEHGSYAGFQTHKRRNDPPCDSCRAARNAYMARYRAEHPADYAVQIDLSAARSRALTRLARQYPDDFRKFYEEERTG